ncbi:hypothetical protein TOK_0367 [Pseudonocardia sp. N23]|nr:hypothetical protein TOK_0367 [Pseudonocardia sp. N23]
MVRGMTDPGGRGGALTRRSNTTWATCTGSSASGRTARCGRRRRRRDDAPSPLVRHRPAAVAALGPRAGAVLPATASAA